MTIFFSSSVTAGFRMTSAGRRSWHAADVEVFLRQMQQMQNTWMQQILQRHKRKERLVSSILESTASVLSTLMDGVHSLWLSMPPAPSQLPQLPRYTRDEYQASDEHSPVYHDMEGNVGIAYCFSGSCLHLTFTRDAGCFCYYVCVSVLSQSTFIFLFFCMLFIEVTVVHNLYALYRLQKMWTIKKNRWLTLSMKYTH